MEELNLEQLRTTLPHDEYRKLFQWGTYGKNGDQPLKFICLKDISDDHLMNIISNLCQYRGNDSTLSLMQNERAYRSINGITVPEYTNIKDFKFLQ